MGTMTRIQVSSNWQEVISKHLQSRKNVWECVHAIAKPLAVKRFGIRVIGAAMSIPKRSKRVTEYSVTLAGLPKKLAQLKILVSLKRVSVSMVTTMTRIQVSSSWQEVISKHLQSRKNVWECVHAIAKPLAVKRFGIRVIGAAMSIPKRLKRVTEYSVTLAGLPKKTCPTENFGELEKGFCVYGNNYDQNAGVVKLAGGDFKTPTKQKECLGMCACYSKATGCETIWDQGNRGCYVHTEKVEKGNGVQRHSCWIAKKNLPN